MPSNKTQLKALSDNLFASAKPDKIQALEQREFNDELIDSMGQTDTTADGAITNAKLANMAGNSIKGRTESGSGAVLDILLTLNSVLARGGGNLINMVFGANTLFGRTTGELQVLPTIDLEDTGHSTLTAVVNLLRQWFIGTVYRAYVSMSAIGASQTNQTLFNSTTGQFFSGGISFPQAASPNLFIPNGYCKEGMRIRIVITGIVTHHASTGIVFNLTMFNGVRHTHTSSNTGTSNTPFILTVDVILATINNSTGTMTVISRYEVDGKNTEVKRTLVTGLNNTQASLINLTVNTGASESITAETSTIEIAG